VNYFCSDTSMPRFVRGRLIPLPLDLKHLEALRLAPHILMMKTQALADLFDMDGIQLTTPECLRSAMLDLLVCWFAMALSVMTSMFWLAKAGVNAGLVWCSPHTLSLNDLFYQCLW